VGRPGGHQRAQAAQGAQKAIARIQRRFDGGEDLVRLRHAPEAVLAAGHVALVGADGHDAARLQGGEVRLGRGVLPHAHVHRRGDQHRLVGGEQRGGGQVVGAPLRHLGQDVGGGRRHHQQVGVARQLDVAHLRLVGEVEELAVDLVAAQGRERQRRHELRARLGENAAHRRPPLLQAADQFQRFVGCDPA